MLRQTNQMKTLDSFMSALDGERWSDNSGTELTHLLSNAVTFSKLEDVERGFPQLKLVDCGDKFVGVVVLTIDKH